MTKVRLIPSIFLLAQFVIFCAMAIFPQYFFISKVNLQVSLESLKLMSGGENLFSEQVISGLRLRSSKEGRVIWTLNADQAQTSGEELWSLTRAEGQFLGENQSVFIKSNLGEINMKDRRVNLMGDVKSFTDFGYSFFSDELTFDQAQKKITTELPVLIESDSEKIRVNSTGFLFDLDSGQAELLNDVSCLQSVMDFNDVLIKSDKAIIRSNLRDIRFSENLVVQQQKFIIKGQEAFFEYDAENSNQLKSIRVTGDIRASDGIKTAISEEVEMKLKEDIILFQGSPRLKMGDNELVGEEILISNNQQNIQVMRGNIKSNTDDLTEEEQE